MHKAHKALRAMPVCAFLLAGCAVPETSAALKDTFDSGVTAYDAGDYAKAYKIWSGIDDVDLAAMRNVAMMLRRGQGVAKDPKKAEELYQTAAEAGLPTAQADLADMLLKGEAGPPNPKAALPLLEAASAANHPVAQYELAQMYETGEGGLVPKDIQTAKELYAAAASHGMKEAQARLDLISPPTDATVRLMQPAPSTPTTSVVDSGTLRPGQP
jgi:TPR repeat protein